MNARTLWRSLLIMTAIPAGWTIGYVAVWRIGLAVLSDQGRSYEDLRTVLLSAIAGAALGAVVAAGCAWHFTRSVTNEDMV